MGSPRSPKGKVQREQESTEKVETSQDFQKRKDKNVDVIPKF
jgi:hypothetical protein